MWPAGYFFSYTQLYIWLTLNTSRIIIIWSENYTLLNRLTIPIFTIFLADVHVSLYYLLSRLKVIDCIYDWVTCMSIWHYCPLKVYAVFLGIRPKVSTIVDLRIAQSCMLYGILRFLYYIIWSDNPFTVNITKTWRPFILICWYQNWPSLFISWPPPLC